MVRPKNSFKFYFIIAVFISIIVFSAGISLGVLFNSSKQDYLSSDIDELKISIQNAELEMMMMDFLEKNTSCNYLNAKSLLLMNQASDLGSKVDTYEKTNSQRTNEYVTLKSEYMSLLIKNWIVLENIKTQCNSNFSTILYFYKTQEECLNCSNQGVIVSHLKSKYDTDLMVFALDSSLDLSFINLLEESYNLTEYPSLVINNELYSGFISMNEIEELI